MYLQYGAYRHDPFEAEAVITREPVWAEGGQLKSLKERWQIKGLLQADTPELLTLRIQAMKAAYALQAQNLSLFLEGGIPTAHNLVSAYCIGGTRVVAGPNFPEGKGAEYTTYRTYDITVEGEIYNPFGPGSTPQLNLVAYAESISFEGTGGPLDVIIQTMAGPVKQRVALATPQRVIQEGTATGYVAYPDVNLPLWPDAMDHPRCRVGKKLPKRSGTAGAPAYTDWEVNWHYEFVSEVPLDGLPTLWPQ